MPFTIITQWLEKEQNLGSKNSDCAVLATATSQGIPHSRVVAIREISSTGILFFTHSLKRKAIELKQNRHASITFWLPLQGREIILDGKVECLSLQENEVYWRTVPRQRQLRFLTYSPTSNAPINSLTELEEKYQSFLVQVGPKDIPMSKFYCGFKFIPEEIYFYTLSSKNLSQHIKYVKSENGWQKELLSP